MKHGFETYNCIFLTGASTKGFARASQDHAKKYWK
jgi:hypothetical protein